MESGDKPTKTVGTDIRSPGKLEPSDRRLEWQCGPLRAIRPDLVSCR
jgi:hypothetical protein